MAWASRVGQFFGAVFAHSSAEDDAFATRWLPPRALRLFRRQSAYERRHSVALARRLLERQPPVEQALIETALLHDIGKMEARLTPWDRTVFVLLSAWPSRPLRRLRQPRSRSPLYALWVLQRHPQLGAERLHGLDLSERTRWLIAHHHSSVDDEDLRIFQEADGR